MTDRPTLVETIDKPLRPIRQNVKTINSDEVMGPGSWVKIRSLLVSEHTRYQTLIRTSQQLVQSQSITADEIAQNEASLRELLCSGLLAWNWVDDEGNDMPQPHNNPGIIEQLTDEEVEFLMELVLNNGAKKKRLSLK